MIVEDAFEFTSDFKDYLSYIIKVITKEAVNEEDLAKLIVLACLSAKSNKPMNIAINAPPGEGKTHTIIKTIELFPNKDVICIAGMTPKALFHRPGQLVIKDETGKYISLDEQLEKINSQIKDFESDILSTDDDTIKQTRQYQIKELQQEIKDLPTQSRKLIDLTGLTIVFLDTPPVELFTAIMSLLSHDRNEAEYDFTDSNNGIKTKTNVLRGFPAIIFTAAIDYTHFKRYAEIQRRFIVVNPKMTREKYSNAVKQISIKKSIPKFLYEKEVISDAEKDKARKMIINIQQEICELCNGPDKLSHNEIFNPFYETLSDCLPHMEAADMNAADRFFDFISLSTLVNYRKRPRIKFIKERDILIHVIPLATFDDLREAMSLMDYNNGVRSYVLEWYNDVFLNVYNDKLEPDTKNEKTEDRIAVTTRELIDKTLEIKNKSLSSKQILENYIYPLFNCNYISTIDSQIDHRAKIYYPVAAKGKNNNLFETMRTNKSSQNYRIHLQSVTIYPSKDYINTKISEIMKYSSNYKLFILEDEDGIQRSIDEIINRYYDRPDDYFILNHKNTVSDEYYQTDQNDEQLQTNMALGRKDCNNTTEQTKDLIESFKTNNLLYLHPPDSQPETIQTSVTESTEPSPVDGTSDTDPTLTSEIIDRFFVYDPDLPYRSPPVHTLVESPFRSIIKQDNNQFYYCTLHPNEKNINLETIEHHIICYNDHEINKTEMKKVLGI